MKCKLNQLKVSTNKYSSRDKFVHGFFLLCEAHTEVRGIMVPAALTGTRQEAQGEKKQLCTYN